MDFLLKGNTLILIIFTMALLLTPWTDAQSKCVYVCLCVLFKSGIASDYVKGKLRTFYELRSSCGKQTQVIVLQLKNKSFFIFFRNFVSNKRTQIGLIFVVEYVSCLLSNLCNSHR